MPSISHQAEGLESFMKLASKLYLAYTSAEGFKSEGHLKGDIYITSQRDIRQLESGLIDEMNRISTHLFYDNDQVKKVTS